MIVITEDEAHTKRCWVNQDRQCIGAQCLAWEGGYSLMGPRISDTPARPQQLPSDEMLGEAVYENQGTTRQLYLGRYRHLRLSAGTCAALPKDQTP